MRRSAFWVSWLMLFALSAVWALSNPIGAAPDEPAHLIKAASVARGQWIGQSSDLGQIVQVPRYVQYTSAQTCFAFQPDTPASCAAPTPEGASSDMVDATTSAGLYNPLYYLLIGWPTLVLGDSAGVYAMRLVSAAVCSLFLAMAVAMILRWRNPGPAVIGLLVATTPMVVYLNSSVNPNALEVSAIVALFVAVLGVVIEPRRDLLLFRAAVVAVSASVAVNARGLSPLWVVVALGLPLLLLRRDELLGLLRARSVQVAMVAVAAATALALGWLVSSSSLTAGIDDPSAALEPPGVGSSAVAGFLTTLDRTFGLGLGLIGVFGWLDTPAPEVVFFLWSALIGGLAIGALVVLRGRSLVFAFALIGGVLLLPPVVQGAYISGGGFIWQGRYTLPVFVCLAIGLASLLGRSAASTWNAATFRRLLTVVLIIWGGCQFYALVTNLKRYTAGADSSWRQALLSPEWSPPGGVLLWVATGAVTVGVAVVLTRRAVRLASPDLAGAIEAEAPSGVDLTR